MGQARVNRRRRKQMVSNNAHLSGMGVSRYGRLRDAQARVRRLLRAERKAEQQGRSFGFGSK